MNSLQTTQHNQTSVELDNSKCLISCKETDIAKVITTLSSIRENKSTPEQIMTASVMIQKEYPSMLLGELRQIIFDGIMQKYNNSNSVHYNDIPTLFYWLREYKLKNMKITW